MANIDCDVVIAGAGMAGLLLASELSKYASVVVLEKSSHIPCHKYWVTPRECLEQNPFLSSCVDTHYTAMDLISYDEATFRCKGDYVLWKGELLLKTLQATTESNGGSVISDRRFYSYRHSKNAINVMAGRETISARLLIDAMGFASPVIYAKDAVSIYGYYIAYGRTLNLRRPIEPICAANVSMGPGMRYLEVFPTGDDKAHAILFGAERTLTPTDSLAGEFRFLTEESSYSNYFQAPVDDEKPLFGVLPVGTQKKKALDRVFFYGESGQMSPPATGACLTRLLLGFKRTAAFLDECIRRDELSSQSLSQDQPYLTPFCRRAHESVFRAMLHWRPDHYRAAVRQLSLMGDDLVNDILFGNVQLDQDSLKAVVRSAFQAKSAVLARPMFFSLLR